MTTIEQTIGFYEIGTTFDVVLPIVRNKCDYLVPDVSVVLTIPAGLALDSYDLDKGTYNVGTTTWELGSVLPTPTGYVEATFTFIVTDDCPMPYSILFTLNTGSTCDDCFTITEYTVNVSGVSCCQVQGCITIPTVYNHDHGDILYVSINGDDATAVKADPERPWDDPWTALAAASAGDTIHVHPGVYAITETGGGGAIEVADFVEGEVDTVLVKNGITFYFEPGAVIDDQTSFGCQVIAGSYVIFGLTEFAIRGHLEFIGHRTNQVWSVTGQLSNGCKLVYEMDKIQTVEGGYVMEMSRMQGVDISWKLRRHEIDMTDPIDTTVFLRMSGTGAGNNTGNIVNVEIDEVECLSGQVLSYVTMEARWDTSIVNVKIGNANIIAKGEALLGINATTAGTFNRNRISYEVGNVIHQDPRIIDATYASYTVNSTTTMDDDPNSTNANDLPSIFGIGDSWGGNSGTNIYDNVFDLKIGSADISGVVLGRLFFAPNSGNNARNINISCTVGNVISRNGSPCFLPYANNGTSFSAENAFRVMIRVLGRAIASVPVIFCSNEASYQNFEFIGGSYKTTGAGIGAIEHTNANHTLTLNGVTLLNDGSVDVITSSVAVNTHIKGVYANSTVIDANVTEVGDAIVRNVNFN